MDLNDNSRLMKASLLVGVFIVFLMAFSISAMAVPLAGSNANADAVLANDTGTFINYTLNATNATANDVFFVNATGDYFYVGMNYLFNQINFSVSTAGVNWTQSLKTTNLTWQYSNGSGATDWKPLGLDTDTCANFTQLGNCTVAWVTLSDMATQAINGSTYYWIRVNVTNGSAAYSTVPRFGQISLIEWNVNLTVRSELGVGLSGLNLNSFATNGTGGVVDQRTINGASGIYQLALMTGETHAVTVTKSGYVNATVNTAVLNSSLYQFGNSHNMSFGLKVILADELGTNVTGVGAAFRGTSPNTTVVTSLYFDDTSGTGGGLNISKDGYVQTNITNSALSNITTSAASQVVITLGNFSINNSVDINRNASMKGMEFSQKVNATSELNTNVAGAAVAIGTSTCTYSAATLFYYCAINVSDDAVANDINVTLNGYVERLGTSGDRTANTSIQYVNNMTNIRYSKQVAVTDELSNNVSGAIVKAASGAITCAENGTAGRYFCVVETQSDGGTNDINATRIGLVHGTSDSLDRQKNNVSQHVINISLKYTIKITNATNELGTQLMPIDGAEVIIAADSGSITYNSGNAYINATAATTNLTASKPGYVNKTSSASVSNLTQNITNVSSLLYTIKLTNITNELGTYLLPIDGAEVIIATDNGSVTYNGNKAYINATAATTNLTASKAGYVNKTGSATVSNSAQNLTNITNLLYTIKVTNVTNEIGSQLTPMNSTEVIITASNGSVTYSSGIAYINATANAIVTAARVGYVNTTTGTLAVSNSAQNITNVTNLLFGIKVTNVTDELGNYLLPIDGTTVIITSGSGTVFYNDNKAYITATMNTTVTAARSGLVNKTTATLAVSDGAQNVTNATSLLYTIKVENLTDELGSYVTIDGTQVKIVSTSGNTTYNGNKAYINATANATLTASRSGWVNKTTGTLTVSDSAQNITNVSSMLFAIKVINMTNELGTVLGGNIDGTNAKISTDSGTVTYNGNKAYINATAAATNLTGWTAGYVNKTGNATVSALSQNVTNISNMAFLVKVTIRDELGGGLNGATVTLGTSDTEITDPVAVDGGSNDGDGISDGVVYFARNPVIAGQRVNISNITVTLNGYVFWANASEFNLTAQESAGQITRTSTNQFTIKVTNVTNELGTQLMPMNSTEVIIATNSGGVTYSGGIAYINATSASTTLTASRSGYVNTTATAAVSSTAQNITNITNVLFTIKVTNVTNELGTYLLPIDGAEVIITSTSGSVAYSGNKAYINATANAILTAAKTGYVNKTTATLAVSNSAQNATNVSSLLFAIKVTNITDELGNNLGAMDGTEIIISTTTGTVAYSGGNAYINATSGATLTASKAGYVNRTGVELAVSNSAQNITNVTGLRFTIKITNATDELGNQLGDKSAVNVKIASSSGNVTYSSGVAYINALANATVTGAKDGYINMTPVQLAVSNSAQNISNVSNMPFSLKITLTNELAKNMSSTTVNVTDNGGVYSSQSPTNTSINITHTISYFALNASQYDLVVLKLNQSGYITQIDNSSNNYYGLNTSTQRALSKTLQYTVKVVVKDELNNLRNVTITEMTSSASVEQNTSATGMYFMAVPHGTVTNINISKQGFVTRNISDGTANETNGASQVYYEFNSTQNGMQFAFKVLGVYDELGNQWTVLNGQAANGTLIVQSDMTAITDYNTSSSSAWIAANGSLINATLQRWGYVNNTISNIAYDSTSQKTLIFNASGANYNASNGMKYVVKIIVKNELGTNLTANVNITNMSATGLSTLTPNATTDTTYYFALNQSQFTNINISTNSTGYVTASDTNSSNKYQLLEMPGQLAITYNLSYTVKINATDELGTRFTLNSTNTTITGLNNISAHVYNGGFVYIPANPATQSLLYVFLPGFINASTVANITPSASIQTLVNYTGSAASGQNGNGIRYSLRVNVTAAGGGAELSGVTSNITSGSTVVMTNATVSNGGSYYYAINTDNYSTLNISVSKSGYISLAALNLGINRTTQRGAIFALSSDLDTPGQPVATSPANTSVITSSTPILQWSAATDVGSGVQYYELQVTNISASNFTTLAVNQSTLTSTAYIVPAGTLTSGQTYYWRVRARDATNNAGSWSDVTQFIYFVGNYTQDFSTTGWHVFQFLPKTVVENNLTSLGGNYSVTNVLSTIASKYTIVYDYNDATQNWTSYVPGASVNSLSQMNQTSPWYAINMNATGTVRIQ
ncbi:MAG: hypothetical protein HZB65_04330 [Candidatus Aenigmarchaeota archaeon]|nr:hypothetical protein [Candidatus Aenigmarchaeota archaeon]